MVFGCDKDAVTTCKMGGGIVICTGWVVWNRRKLTLETTTAKNEVEVGETHGCRAVDSTKVKLDVASGSVIGLSLSVVH